MLLAGIAFVAIADCRVMVSRLLLTDSGRLRIGRHLKESCISAKEATVGFEPTNKGFAILRLSHLATSPSLICRKVRRCLRVSQDPLTGTIGMLQSVIRILSVFLPWSFNVPRK